MRARILAAAAVALALCALWALAACELFAPKFEKPRLSVVDIQIGKTGLWEQNLRVRMRVENPNDRALPVRGITYELDVAGQEAAHGGSTASFTVPPRGETEFDMDMNAHLASTLIRLLGRGGAVHADQIDYRISGKVELSSGLLRSIPFEQRGVVSLR